MLLWREDDSRVRAAHAAGRTPTTEDMYDVVPFDEIVGWQNQCDCGWRGSFWDASEFRIVGNPDPELVVFGNGRTLEAVAHDEWLDHAQGTTRLDRIEAAAARFAAARIELDKAVMAARAGSSPLTWEEIATATGMTRQSAHQRWANGRRPYLDGR